MKSWGTRVLLVLVILVLLLPFIFRSLLMTAPRVASARRDRLINS